ncbi:hypothetical protein T440DRAFT_553673 [Plenodomus tracheiphilus IPT5]|uniref:Uncharacterized protein n=1 Tax=Plenodomus tracheiphilus IPT5 TaxID=1408161 RepID=A0A6A7BBY2_9PLEO|nr:hypothetical protein T440DRAFT_553673 [Plenodomus tracheiphilus IPT5]
MPPHIPNPVFRFSFFAPQLPTPVSRHPRPNLPISETPNSATRDSHWANTHTLTAKMCIIYYATFAKCPHRDYVGCYHCGHFRCNIPSQHIFGVEDAGYPCDMCFLLDRQPEMPAVKWYPPVSDEKLGLMKQPGMAYPKVVVMEMKDPSEEASVASTYASSFASGFTYSDARSMSDVDSATSYWRLDASGIPADMQASIEKSEEKSDGGSEGSGSGSGNSNGNISSADSHTTYYYSTGDTLTAGLYPPGTNLPPGFVLTPSRTAGSPTSDILDVSPNTAKHRNLVQDQLAALPEPIPTRPFAESLQDLPAPVLRTVYQPAFSPMLPAGLPSYPVLPHGLINDPVYSSGLAGEHFLSIQGGTFHARAMPIMTGERFPGLHRGSSAVGGPVLVGEYMPSSFQAGPSAHTPSGHGSSTHGPPPLNIENFPSLHSASGTHGRTSSRRIGMSRCLFNAHATYSMNAPSSYNNTSVSYNSNATASYNYNNAPASGTGHQLFNMNVPFNSSAQYNNYSEAVSDTNVGMNMTGSALNPLAPQFRGTANGREEATTREDEWSYENEGYCG